MAQQLEPYYLAKFLEVNGFVKNIICTASTDPQRENNKPWRLVLDATRLKVRAK